MHVLLESQEMASAKLNKLRVSYILLYIIHFTIHGCSLVQESFTAIFLSYLLFCKELKVNSQ